MIKIIAGSAKGISLLSPGGRSTRPTLGRLRESIFNVLSNVGLLETRVLDIFSGTGAMGLEALSRGAESAVMIDHATAGLIRKNAVRCHVADRARVLAGDVKTALRSLEGKKFDYIFMDPPYGKGYIEEVLSLVFACRLPAGNAIIVVEHTSSEPLSVPENCEIWKEKRQGHALVTYLLCKNT